MSVIASLSVLLGLDSGGFTSGLKSASGSLKGFTGGMDRFEGIARSVKDFAEIALVVGNAMSSWKMADGTLEQQKEFTKNIDQTVKMVPILGGIISAFTTGGYVAEINAADKATEQYAKRVSDAIKQTNAFRAFASGLLDQSSAASNSEIEEARRQLNKERDQLEAFIKQNAGKDGKLSATNAETAASARASIRIKELALQEKIGDQQFLQERELQALKLRNAGELFAAERVDFETQLAQRAQQMEKFSHEAGQFFKQNIAPQLILQFDKEQAEKALADLKGRAEEVKVSPAERLELANAVSGRLLTGATVGARLAGSTGDSVPAKLDKVADTNKKNGAILSDILGAIKRGGGNAAIPANLLNN